MVQYSGRTDARRVIAQYLFLETVGCLGVRIELGLFMVREVGVDGAGAVESLERDDHGEVVWEGEATE